MGSLKHLRIFILMLALSLGSLASAHANICLDLFTSTRFVSSSSSRAFLRVEYPTYSAPEQAQRVFDNYNDALQLAGQLGASQNLPALTIVIPAYKEAARLPRSVQRMKDFFEVFPFPVEIMIRIEKSPDNTVEVTQQAVGDSPIFKVFPHPVQRGKGYAVKQGMLEANGAYILFMDADLSTPLPEVFNILARAYKNQNVDVFIGDRQHKESDVVQKQSFRRQVIGSVFRFITTTTLSTVGLKGICDTQCGFKMFSAPAAKRVFNLIETNGFAFDVEALMLSSRLGFEVLPIPIQWVDDARSTVNPIVDAPKMLIDTIKMHRRIRNRTFEGNENE